MFGEISDEISIRIDQKRSGLSDTSRRQLIFKVHSKLRSENEEAYEPQVVSIGPYHRDKPKLIKMEQYKLMYLNVLLHRRGESSAKKYVEAMVELQQQAKSSYAEEINLEAVDFVEMLCLDGCFVIEFLRKLSQPELYNESDPIFQMSWLISATKKDLILFENQLPFIVLQKLFDMTKSQDEEKKLNDLAILGLSSLMPVSYPGQSSRSTIPAGHEVVHLLDLMHKNLTASFSNTLAYPKHEETKTTWQNFYRFKKKKPSLQKPVIELLHSGTQFKRAKKSESVLRITFENGVVKIPPLFVDDHTESIFRNFIAYEQYMSKPFETWRYVTDYISFMDLLIDSPSDVEKLRNRGIIRHGLGNDKAVSAMFNKLSSDVSIESPFCYDKILEKMREYCSKRPRTWWANLMRNYFHTPWSIISCLAACILLLLALVQAIFSILH
ncbi:UPF0481 protein At3g47200-like [Coffea arabica]|uniref:UPF0481 protein At3g47200-like n=1 Tax=Coffea arabica TaxID=13443 RepID=A0A6P6WMN3_COFAR|nr:UPF0481 protein At3g47200-like [Coffea arabica]